MTPYSRGYAAGLKAAAALVPTDDTRELCCNGYDCECRKPEDAAFVAAEIEARRVKKAILSLPIVGEATNPGEQVPDSARIGSEPHVTTPARPGPSQECVMVPVEPTEKMLAAVREVVDEIPPYFGLTGNALNEQLWKAIAAMLAAAKEE